MSRDYYITTACMGYGHLRAADNVAALGRTAGVLRVDRAPCAGLLERGMWSLSRRFYHGISRSVESRHKLLFRLLDWWTAIPSDPKDASLGFSKFIRGLVRLGMGRTISRCPELAESALLHTFFVPALAALEHRCSGRNYLLICDADMHRIWVPVRAATRSLTYLVPLSSGADRLRGYGVPADRIVVTGFPLPPANTGGEKLEVLRDDVARRRRHLQPGSREPMTLLFSLSGAGCYVKLLKRMLTALTGALKLGTVRFIAGLHDNRRVYAALDRWLKVTALDATGAVSLLYDADIRTAFRQYNAALRTADLLVTKPGELVFYAALGVPQILLPCVGRHEQANRSFLVDQGCALDFPGCKGFAQWMETHRAAGDFDRIIDRSLAVLPQRGAFHIDEVMRGGDMADRRAPGGR
jgi:hypothetical protein